MTTDAAARPSFRLLRIQRPAQPLDLRKNLVAGVVVGVIALPLSIALAIAVGVPPVAGLYTAVFAGAITAIFGGSSNNITGPTAALVPVLSHAVILHGPQVLPLLALMSGCLLLLMSALKAGRLVAWTRRDRPANTMRGDASLDRRRD